MQAQYDSFFSWTHLRVCHWHDVHHPQVLGCVIPTNQDILHNLSTAITVRGTQKVHLFKWLSSKPQTRVTFGQLPQQCPFWKGSSWETPVAFSFLLSPISFNLGPSLSPLATVTQPWSFWRAQTSYFVFVPRWNISTNDTHWQFKNGWFCFSSISFRLDIPEQEHRMATAWLSQVQQGSRGSLD